jgi:hypothetical protein
VTRDNNRLGGKEGDGVWGVLRERYNSGLNCAAHKLADIDRFNSQYSAWSAPIGLVGFRGYYVVKSRCSPGEGEGHSL